jgi:hypothetical protein
MAATVVVPAVEVLVLLDGADLLVVVDALQDGGLDAGRDGDDDAYPLRDSARPG